MQTYSVSRGSLMSRVFLGLFASLLFATIGVYAGQFVPPVLVSIAMFAEIIMIVVAMFLQRRRTIGYPFVFSFTFISGLTLYPTIAYYTQTYGSGLVLEALGVTAISFLVASIVASRSSMDFSFLGGFLFIGLIALILMGIVSFFVHFGTTGQLIYSFIGIAIFIGYILFDVNRLSKYGVAEQYVPWIVLSLYLDIINLFLFILQFFGVSSNSRR
ncbi:Bax inhibitor-1 family protein [Alicyclobacillus tolerans]|uniref:FtsH-binding integral membrane protein n=3 Tax=Alicyclobacillaceae TaxID=186823 RepID=A0ABT9LY40_9BACL|nr:Bax inhibitor-1/YccA family protein [Alicyclobacillus tengchongensis]MDP9729185.1 FtsH-binding integral membrane protein [Alicyclobacillus tengchongensis]SHK03166.1 hypothetical protein SAMN05443507_10793 [Alicyclobacillus montanus]